MFTGDENSLLPTEKENPESSLASLCFGMLLHSFTGEFSGPKDVHRRSIFFSHSALFVARQYLTKKMNVCEQAKIIMVI